MAKVHVLVLVVCQILCLPTLCYSDDDNPFLDLASSFIQNMASDSGKGNNMDGLAAIGNIVGSLMQGDNAKNLGSLFGQENGGAGDVLSGELLINLS